MIPPIFPRVIHSGETTHEVSKGFTKSWTKSESKAVSEELDREEFLAYNRETVADEMRRRGV